MATATPLLPRLSGIHRDDLLKAAVILALTLVAFLLTFYSFQHNLGDFLLVLYLIPLVLASLWYPRYGLLMIGIVVVGAFITIFYTSWTGLSPNPLRYALYTAIFVWIIAVITVSTMEGRSSLAHTMSALRGQHGNRQDGPSTGAGHSVGTVLSDRDLENIIDALSLPDPAAREVAIRALGKSGNPRAVEPLIALLGSGHRDTREHAVRALGSLGEMAVEPLIRALGDPDWHVRTGAAVALRIIGDPRAIDPLVRLLSDDNRFVRREAAKSLGRIGDGRAVDPLIQSLDDEDSGVRGKAILALGRLGDIRAHGPLGRLVDDPNPDVRLAAMDALSKLRK